MSIENKLLLGLVAILIVIFYLIFKEYIVLYGAIVRDIFRGKATRADLFDTGRYRDYREEQGAELIAALLNDRNVRSYSRRYGKEDVVEVTLHEFPNLGRAYEIDLASCRLMVTSGTITVPADPRQLMSDIASELPHLDPLGQAKKIRSTVHSLIRWDTKYRD